MISKRNLALGLAVGVGLVVSVISLVVWNREAETRKIWKTLEGLAVQVVPNSTNADLLLEGGWWLGARNGNYEVGQVTLKDGSAWQFAFASHHVVERPQSFVVFKNGPHLIRAQGDGFCCEVQFDDLKQPSDSVDFLSQLRVQYGFTTSSGELE